MKSAGAELGNSNHDNRSDVGDGMAATMPSPDSLVKDVRWCCKTKLTKWYHMVSGDTIR